LRASGRLKTYDLPREARLCRRCDIYQFGQCDPLFVSLKKPRLGLHGLLALRSLPAASCTPRWPGDLSPTQLPGREYRSVQQPGLRCRAGLRPALVNLAPSQLILNIAVCLKPVQHGKAEPQRRKASLFVFFSMGVMGLRGLKPLKEHS